MTKDEMKNRISMALKDPILQQGFECICKELEAEKKLNEEIKVRFVKCNTCTDEMKDKCIMFSENLCEGERCEELVDLMELINKSDLQKENAELKEENKKTSNDWLEACNKYGEVNLRLTKATEIVKAFLLIAKVEHFEDRYETVDEAKAFLKETE